VEGDLVVSAAAGSGKTAVLAERCARLVCGPGVVGRPRTGVENLLVLTFTEAAAAEMRTRIADALAGRLHAAPAAEQGWLRRQVAMIDRASISTLHAFCGRILRQHFHEAQVDPAFEILDEEEAQLLQEEVFEELLVRWHNLPAGDAAGALSAAAFAEFFEAYAQGRQGICRDLVLALHRMLASTVDPVKYVTEARALYGAGAEKTLADYSGKTLAQHLRLAQHKAGRALEQVRADPDTQTMVEGLERAFDALGDALHRLQAQGTVSWPDIATLLTFKWPTLRTPASWSDFESFKKRNWQAIKETLKDLVPLFAPDSGGMVRDLRNLARPLDTLLTLTGEFEKAFTAAKRADNRLDFADLERLAHGLLTRPQGLARAELQGRYHYLLVDEFQDINPLQEAILEALRHPAAAGTGQGNLFVVGDIKQSIYAFRLAQPKLFLKRERDARQVPKSFVTLQNNFRSHPALLAAMNRVFEKILTRAVVGIDYADGHALQPPPTLDAAPALATPEDPAAPVPFAGAPIELHMVAMKGESEEAGEEEFAAAEESGETDEKKRPVEDLSPVEHEARVVAQRIAELLVENRGITDKSGTLQPLRPRHIAILLRTMKHKAMVFARALADRGIPVHADLSSGFFDTQEVKDVLALLQVLDNPQQDIPLVTVLVGPFGNFTHDDLGRIRLAFDRREVPFHEAAAAGGGLAAGATNPRSAEPVPEELGKRLRDFFGTLARWRELLRARPLHEGLAEVFAESKILAYVAGLDTGAQRVANLELLHQRALQFGTFKKQGLHRFLRFIERLREREEGGVGGGGDVGEAPIFSEASDVVRILSVHKSKGLEFPVVFVSGLGGRLRLSSGGPMLLHQELGIGLYATDLERNITYPSAAALRIAAAQRREARAEELRLLYVAMTRARSCLILTGHVNKDSEIEEWREAWAEHQGAGGALPEDLLVEGVRALDWLMPAIVGNMATAPFTYNAVMLHVHKPQAGRDAAPAAVAGGGGASAERLKRIREARPVEAASEARVERLIERVTGTYAHDAAAQQAAVQTVTFLKTLQEEREAAGEPPEASPAELEALAEAAGEEVPVAGAELARRAEEARLRGIATHRILELLDFTACDSAEAIARQVEGFVAGKLLTAEEAARADRRGIEWFVGQSAAGRRVVETARRIAAERAAAGGRPGLHLRREIPFTWLGQPQAKASEPEADPAMPLFAMVQVPPPATDLTDLADLPTIRGVIDVLLADPAARRAEVMDYKTDGPKVWESRLEDYRRQMKYYLAATSDILGFPVENATLVFLSARREITVTRD
jgi:ATP-dependent helicase/nuclease subunit A